MRPLTVHQGEYDRTPIVVDLDRVVAVGSWSHAFEHVEWRAVLRFENGEQLRVEDSHRDVVRAWSEQDAPTGAGGGKQ